MSTKRQGDLGVAAGIQHYTQRGYIVSYPLTDAARYDLIIDTGTQLVRIQCKTTDSVAPSGSPVVRLETCGGNQSGRGKRKTISSKECERVLVLALCNGWTLYEFPVEIVEGKTKLTLGKKYDVFIANAS